MNYQIEREKFPCPYKGPGECPEANKDYCTCGNQYRAYLRRISRDKNVAGTIKMLDRHKINYVDSGTPHIVVIVHNGKKVYVSLKKDNYIIKCRFEGSPHWYKYSTKKFIAKFTHNANLRGNDSNRRAGQVQVT